MTPRQTASSLPRRLALWLGLAGLLGSAAALAQPAPARPAWRLAGYNKTLALDSRTVDEEHQRYALLLNRTRLKASWLPSPSFELQLENDTEVRAGSYLRTAQAQAEAARPQRRWADLRSSGSCGDSCRVDNDFFRAWGRWTLGDADLTVGRQRIALGTGRLWSTLDFLNPLNPLQVERDEYVGVDAVLAEQRLGDLSRASLVYAPQPGGGSPRWVAGWHTHQGGADLGLSVARSWGDTRLGADIATQIGGLGLRGELSATRPRTGRRHAAAMLGLDYAFENTLTLSVEAYASSQRPAQRALQMAAEPSRADVLPLGSRYAGLVGSYEFTPLLKLTLVALSNRQDGSRFGSAALAWSVAPGFELQGGLQRFAGAADSEYGRGQALAYLQLQWFFQGATK